MRYRLGWLAAAVIVASTLSAADARADERRIATLAPEGSLWVKELERAAQLVKRQTDGRILTKYYPGASQGGERDVVRKMRLKQLDGAALTSIGLGLIYPGIRVLEIPFLFDSEAELDYVRAKMWPYFRDKFAERGFELLTMADLGWIHLFSTQPIRSGAALRKAKLWAWADDPMVRMLFKRMELVGVPMGVPEVASALTTGRIDTCYGSPLAAVALQWHSSIKYMSSLPLGYGLAGMVMRTEVWESASPEDKAVQLEIGHKLMRRSIERIRRDNRRAVRAMRKQGMEVSEVSPELEAEVRAAAADLRVEMVGDLYTQEELDMVLRYRAEYREQHGHEPDRGYQ